MRQFIYKIGSNPKRSLRLFLSGLLLACLAGGFIALGYYYQYWYQIIGLVLGVPAVLLMGLGYMGILANRFAQVIKPRQSDRTQL